MAATDFGIEQMSSVASDVMIDAIATTALLTLVNQVSGTPYRTGGDSPSGTDCSGLASWVANAATGRPIYGDRFHTGNERQALLARGFQPGTAPGALVIGWNSGHTAVTLPDGTPVSAGEGGGVKIGGGGAFQSQFTNHMYLPVAPENPQAADPMAPPPPADPSAAPLPADPMAPPPPAPPGPADLPAVQMADFAAPPPDAAPAPEPPAPDVPPVPVQPPPI
ncbi:MAG: NlpC/P60 family protein [Mycobacterium sp.]